MDQLQIEIKDPKTSDKLIWLCDLNIFKDDFIDCKLAGSVESLRGKCM